MSMIYRGRCTYEQQYLHCLRVVPELVEKKTKEIVNDYLGQEIDDFNYVKYNLYESDLTPIIEETLTMPFSQIKSNCCKELVCFTGEKFSKDLNHNSDELIKFLEKYDVKISLSLKCISLN